MKRSRNLTLTTLMASSSLALTACGDGAPASTQWGDQPAAVAGAPDTDVKSFATVAECKAAGDFAPADCDKAYAAAQADGAQNAPRFTDQQSCEERYGVDQCVPRNQAGGGGSFFTPLLTGFIIGQALNNFGGGGYGGRAFYRDRYGDRTLSNGQPLSRGYLGGGDRVNSRALAPSRAEAPARVQSRSAVVSRGGFGGGGGRSYGG